MSKSIHIFLALALTGLALFVAGCGGSDDKATGSGAADTISQGPLSKAEFAKQAEAICTKYREARFNKAVVYRKKHEKELKALDAIPAEEKIIRAIVLPSVAEETAELATLDPPKVDAKKIEAIITQLEAGLKRAKKNPYGIELENPNEYPFRKAGEMIRDYGLTACRNPG